MNKYMFAKWIHCGKGDFTISGLLRQVALLAGVRNAGGIKRPSAKKSSQETLEA